jgi:hypothetical protein
MFAALMLPIRVNLEESSISIIEGGPNIGICPQIGFFSLNDQL